MRYNYYITQDDLKVLRKCYKRRFCHVFVFIANAGISKYNCSSVIFDYSDAFFEGG